MASFWDAAGWPLVFMLATLVVYVVYLRPKLQETALVLGKPGKLADPSLSFWRKCWLKIDGWKTPILLAIAAIFKGGEQILESLDGDALVELKTLPWAEFFDAATANKIASAATILAWVAHVYGVNQAAKTPPLA
ncbi:hypothetical protein [Methylocapsa acidiphila]|uniref:hypothetical protein n=1 Tax=Methylocapsa acidiphila TaxID=133552 RepID=UPI0004297191|nr:hypothetical protein [Methylocapsa acidiphila]